MSEPPVTIPGIDLRVRARRSGARPPFVSGDRLVLDAEPSWFFEGDAADVARAEAALEPFCERIRDDLLEVRFGNSVGIFRVGDNTVIEVRSGKWDQRHFDRMLAEITKVSAALPFSARSGGALPYDRSLAARDDLLYHAFVYVRHILQGHGEPESRLVPAIDLILSEPHHRWTRITQAVRPERVRSIGPSELTKMLAGRHPLDRVGGTDIALARQLNGHMPRHIEDRRLVSSLDTPENRFVKAFLGQVSGIVDRMARHLESAGVGTDEQGRVSFKTSLLRDCTEMQQTLDRIERAGRWLWDELSPMVHIPMASTVLQRKRGYREVFAHFARLRMASRLPMSGAEARRLMEMKDIALLYELWTYFQVVEAVTDALGAPSHAIETKSVDEWERTVGYGMTVRWPNGTRAAYNPAFRSSYTRDRRSYSVGLRPDVALFVPRSSGGELHLFDAKFRLERLTDVMPPCESSDDSVQVDEEERVGTYKRTDLYKMHTYRDAIVAARSAWVLYPGEEKQFYMVDPVEAGEFLPSDGSMLEGVGALPVCPEKNGADFLQAVIRYLVQ